MYIAVCLPTAIHPQGFSLSDDAKTWIEAQENPQDWSIVWIDVPEGMYLDG